MTWKSGRCRLTSTTTSTNFRCRSNNFAKHYSRFWRSIDLLMINCEVELDLTSGKDCVLIGANDKIT